MHVVNGRGSTQGSAHNQRCQTHNSDRTSAVFVDQQSVIYGSRKEHGGEHE